MSPDIDPTEMNFVFHLEATGTTNSHLGGNTSLIDLRQSPKIEAHFYPEASIYNGDSTSGLIIDIYRTGLRLEGSAQMVDTLFPNFKLEDMPSPTSVQVFFTLPSGEAVKVHGEAIYTMQSEKEAYHIGIRFIMFDEGDAALTEHLISRVYA